ncbi:MAG: protein kinase, partial [Candidatus Wallbacteria bacterium]|nr:protein kinase [Candidatus Wallbacteria bacterium]
MAHLEKTISEERTIQEQRTAGGLKPSSAPVIKAFRDFSIIRQMPTFGSEADIYLVEKEEKKNILKLYRFGSDPVLEVMEKVREVSFSHPGSVVRIDESGFDDETGRYFEIMEYAEDGSLRDLWPSGETPPLENIREVVAEMIKGLSALHANHLLHMDLKPSNILVRRRKPLNLIFTDFGISSIIDEEISRKMTIKLKGTPSYWSPEAFTQVVGFESDFWSMGMIILELLCGRHPLQGLDMRVIMYTLSTKGMKIPDNLPDEWALLLKGLLTRDPRKRWGEEQLKLWIAGKRDIPVAYDYRDEPGR